MYWTEGFHHVFIIGIAGSPPVLCIISRRTMPLPWEQIHELEVREDYPAAIDALEDRLRQPPLEKEAVIRLGFNLWYATVEQARMRKVLPTERYAGRFMELFREHRSQLEGDPDFCWAFGLGLSLFWFEFPGADDNLGEALLTRAKELDPFYARMAQEEMRSRFRGRGIFESYYAITEPSVAPNSGPATELGNSEATLGPPSVSRVVSV